MSHARIHMTRLLALLALAFLLTGCSGMRLVESQVNAIATQPASGPIASGARYRFERLPSQADQAHTDTVETLAEAELSEAGLVRDDKAARYSVQIDTLMQSYLVDDWGRPLGGSGPYGHIFIGTGHMGSMMGFGVGMPFPPSSRYRHEVHLIMRELATNQVVYETRATHDGPWNDTYNILRALLAAALRDFPNPPAGPHKVKVEIPR